MLKQIFRFLWHAPRYILMAFIWIYQKTISPDHSFWAKAIHLNGFCKFHPTCSEYMKQSLKKYGVLKGAPKGLWRIGRCNPWSEGGVDEP